MKRKLGVLLAGAIFISLLCFSATAYTPRQPRLSLLYFENYTAQGADLTASVRQILSVIGTPEVTLSPTALRLCAQGEKGNAFDISISIAGTNFTDPVEQSGNYEVLSVLNTYGGVRVVLKDRFAANILYVDADLPQALPYESYRADWYGDFVSGNLAEQSDEGQTTVPFHTRLYSVTNHIFGDTITEYLRIGAAQECPFAIDPRSRSKFKFAIGIVDKWTEFTPYGGDTVITDGCSLAMNNVQIRLKAPEGEYFSYMYTFFHSELPIGSREEADAISHQKPIPPGVKPIAQTEYRWEHPSHFAFKDSAADGNLGARFDMEIEVSTYRGIFEEKELQFEWIYHITGTGINEAYGVSVNTPSAYDSISGTAPYRVVRK